MSKTLKIYKPKRLVDGAVIGSYGKKFVAVPDKGYKDCKVEITFEGATMIISNWHKAVTFRRFHDQFGGKDYTLAYFEWTPEQNG